VNLIVSAFGRNCSNTILFRATLSIAIFTAQSGKP
jgi:hypothetical protein